MDDGYIYYECIQSDSNSFTVGNFYKINNVSNLEAYGNFVDNYGTNNGFAGSNYRHFKFHGNKINKYLYLIDILNKYNLI